MFTTKLQLQWAVSGEGRGYWWVTCIHLVWQCGRNCEGNPMSLLIMSRQIRKRVLARWPRLKIHTIKYQYRVKRNYAEGQKNKQNSEMTKNFQNGLQQNKLWETMDLMLWRTYFRQKKRKPKTALIIWRLDCKLSGCLQKKKKSRKKHTDKLEVDLAMVHGGSYLERKSQLIASPSLRVYGLRKLHISHPRIKPALSWSEVTPKSSVGSGDLHR